MQACRLIQVVLVAHKERRDVAVTAVESVTEPKADVIEKGNQLQKRPKQMKLPTRPFKWSKTT